MTLTRPITPSAEPVPRRPGSVRRISRIDTEWQGDGVGSLQQDGVRCVQHAYARDVRDDEILGEAVIDDVLVGYAQLESMRVVGGDGDVEALIGAHVGSGFRSKARRAFPNAIGTPLGLLFDDLPVATLVAGYARVKQRIDSGIDPASIVAPEGADMRRDLCAGWRADGAMIHSIETGHGIPYPPLPAAPPPHAPDDDANAWIDEPPRAPYVMRRRRRLDVMDGEVLIVSAWFRDSHVEPDGNEGAVHEYSLHATVDPGTFALVTLAATPHVLPYGECPAAAGHVGRMLGADVGELRTLVGDRLSGTSSCTHLNDCVRALADVPALAAQVRRIGA